MGRMYAEEITESGLTLEQQLEWHLMGNHYPPLTSEVIPVCRDVILHLNAGGDVNQHFAPPESWHGLVDGAKSAPAWAIVIGYNLQAWITDEEPWDE